VAEVAGATGAVALSEARSALVCSVCGSGAVPVGAGEVGELSEGLGAILSVGAPASEDMRTNPWFGASLDLFHVTAAHPDQQSKQPEAGAASFRPRQSAVQAQDRRKLSQTENGAGANPWFRL
jgi:hypothetical protein